ncbi:MAG: phosphotransferase [Bdellovibrionaceae bacterium]|nr:phosphotransferase [Bdellovibrionales bacterium]MCB9253416.1 phosphotransferase [Pseudobdellovibrionaceae bacterium]
MALEITSIPAPVTQWASRWLSKLGGDLPPSWELFRLAGDGSTRQFFRLQFGSESRVVLYDPGWRFTKDYAAHQSFLMERGLPVPKFGEVDPDAGFLIMEDLGDVLAQSRIQGSEKKTWLERCVRLLAELHGKTFPVPETLPAFGRAFDREIYGRELRFTIEHLRVGLLGVNAPADLKPIDTFAKSLEKIGPRVFCHRDYHTRNLLVHDEALHLIDFQDARMGPAAYDLCSVLYDAYVPIETDLREELVELYQQELSRFALSKKIDWPNFREELRRVAYQRTLKAAGSFASFFTRYGKKTHLPYLHPCFDNILSLQSVAPTLHACFPVEEWLPKIVEWEKRNWDIPSRKP